MKKTEIFMNKPVYLGLPILKLSKILMCKIWHDYVKPKCGEKVKLRYVGIYSFIVYIQTDDIFKDIDKDVEARFDTSNFERNRPLPKKENKKVIGLMKDELGGQIMKEFVDLRVKA